MKKTILSANRLIPIFSGLSLMVSNLSVYAQLNQHFFGGGPYVGAYVSGIHAGWRNIQQYPTSSYNWTGLDAAIQAKQTAGMRVMIILRCTSPITTADTTPGTCAYILNSQFADGGTSWWPYDTTEWEQFINALVDRYDGDGTNDASWLDTNYRITRWHIGQEWQRIWCTQNPPDSLITAQEFTNYVNMTYAVIKAKQPLSQISFAGIDERHNLEAYYDGYSTQTTMCVNQSCTSPFTFSSPSQIPLIAPGFLAKRRNVLYILRNALSDEIDIHQYGRWTEIPKVVEWLKDSANLGTRKVVFYESGGPFCKSCENIYHSVNDTDGRLPAALVRDNASYVVYCFISGFASGVKNLHWTVGPEYAEWGPIWGDLNLKSINYVAKPSFYTYRFLSKTIFSNANADTVIRITESNPNLYHYQVQSSASVPFIDVAWSTNPTDSIVVSGNGTLYAWNIPTTCDSLGFLSMYPTDCDSVFPMSTYNVSGLHTIALNDGVPVFYSWNNVLGINTSSLTEKISVKVYPNPFSNSTTLQIIPQGGRVITNYELKIYDLFGREVRKYEIGNQKTEILRGDLRSGMYFYQVKNEQQMIGSGKIIIQH